MIRSIVPIIPSGVLREDLWPVQFQQADQVFTLKVMSVHIFLPPC